MRKILTESDGSWFYMQLHMFKRGAIDADELTDDLIKKVKSNGIVQLKFDDESDYFNILDLGDDDRSTLNMVFNNYYGNYEFKDYYSSHDDWNEGIIINHLDSENYELFKKLQIKLKPGLNIEDDKNEFCKFLLDYFRRDIEDIIIEFMNMNNNAIEESIRETAKEELCDVFFPLGIYQSKCFFSYYTTVDNLIKLYDKYGNKTKNLSELLKKISKEEYSLQGRYDEWYDLDYDNYFDDSYLNRVAKKTFGDIEDKLEDNEMFSNYKEFEEISNKISKFLKYDWFPLPKNKKWLVNVQGVDPETNKIIFRYKPFGKGSVEERKIDYENFMLFLYHPELF